MTHPVPPAVKLTDVLTALDLVRTGTHPHRDAFMKAILDTYMPQMIDEIVTQRAVIIEIVEHISALQQQMQAWADDAPAQEPQP